MGRCLCKPDDLSSDLQNPCESQVQEGPGTKRDAEIGEYLVYTAMNDERPCLKQRGG